MADNNGHKSGLGWFNPDDRLKQAVLDIANKRDLKSLKCTFILLLEHPEVVSILGAETVKELHDRYNVSKKVELEKDHKKKIAQYLALGFSAECAEELYQTFPEEKPIDVVKQRNATTNANSFQLQTEIAKKKVERTLEEIDSDIREKERKLKNAEGTPAYNRLEGELAELRKERELLTVKPIA
jgi:hypothetical protein